MLALALIFSSFGAGAKEAPLRGMDYIAKRLTIFTHEDRVDPVSGHSLLQDYNASSTVLKLTMSGGKTVCAFCPFA